MSRRGCEDVEGYGAAATPEECRSGDFRCHNGVECELPMSEPADFDISDPNTFEPPATPADLSCMNCHTAGARSEIEHAPTQIAHVSDEDLIKLFPLSMKRPQLGFRVLPEQFQDLYAEMHTWDATDEEKKGIVAHLRALTPMGQGDILPPGGTHAPPDRLPMCPGGV